MPEEFELRPVARTADANHAYISEQGWICDTCDHRHGGEPVGFICVGCGCERRRPTLPEFDRMRRIVLPAAEYGQNFPLSDPADVPH